MRSEELITADDLSLAPYGQTNASLLDNTQTLRTYPAEMMFNSLRARYYPVDLLDSNGEWGSYLADLTLNTWLGFTLFQVALVWWSFLCCGSQLILCFNKNFYERANRY